MTAQPDRAGHFNHRPPFLFTGKKRPKVKFSGLKADGTSRAQGFVRENSIKGRAQAFSFNS
jgi:hypothetical protein